MKRKSHLRVVGTGFFIFPLFIIPAAIGGTLEKANNVGARAIGMGGVAQGVVSDPTAVFHNPAALTRVLEPQAMASATSLVTFQTHKPTYQTYERSMTMPVVLPFLGGAGELWKNILYVGMAVYAPFGNGFKFPTTSRGGVLPEGVENAALTGAYLYVIEASPALGVKIGPFSAGAAFRGDYSVVTLDSNSGALGGQVKQTGEDFDAGVRVGATYDAERWKAGIVWRDKVQFEYDGYYFAMSANTNNRTALHTTALIVPHAVTGGFAYWLLDNLLVGADLQWSDYSDMRPVLLIYEVATVAGAGSSTIRLDGRDNVIAHVGLEYLHKKNYKFRAGYAFDGETSTNRTITRVFYNGPAHVFTAGFGFEDKVMRIDLAGEFASSYQNIEHNGRNFNPGEYNLLVYTATADLLFYL